MKLEKKHYLIIGIILVIISVYLFLRNKKAKQENSFGHGSGGGGHHGGGGWHHGGRGGWGGGYWGGGYPYPYYDEPIIINSTNCPQGWIWMGAMLGCQKPQG